MFSECLTLLKSKKSACVFCSLKSKKCILQYNNRRDEKSIILTHKEDHQCMAWEPWQKVSGLFCIPISKERSVGPDSLLTSKQSDHFNYQAPLRVSDNG